MYWVGSSTSRCANLSVLLSSVESASVRPLNMDLPDFCLVSEDVCLRFRLFDFASADFAGTSATTSFDVLAVAASLDRSPAGSTAAGLSALAVFLFFEFAIEGNSRQPSTSHRCH